MALKLLDEGYSVVIFDSLETGHIETVERLKSFSKSLVFVKGDLKNKSDINSVFEKYNISAVIHFAAYSLVEESVREPEKYWENNVTGTLNLLSSMIEHSVNKIVFSSTAATYGEPKYIPIDEIHPQKPINPYGETKLAVEKIMDEYDHTYGLKSVRLRYFNVAGADKLNRTGEWHTPETHLIPNIIKSALNEEKIFEIYGDNYNTKDGTCIRDYINIEDLIDAHLKAIKYLENGGRTDFFNLGTKEGSSVKEVFECAKNVIGKEIKYVIKEKREGDPAKLIGSSEKAKEILGWQPKRTLKDSVQTAFSWEKMRQSLYK